MMTETTRSEAGERDIRVGYGTGARHSMIWRRSSLPMIRNPSRS
jgi:hypothetical protein